MELCYLVCAVAAILLHGAGHMLAAALVGTRFGRLRISATGLRLMTDRSFASYRAEAVTALGGPLLNLVGAWGAHALLGERGAVFVVLSLYLGLLNLAPIRGFDGARVLSCVLCARHTLLPSCLPHVAERVIDVLSATLTLLLWLIAVYLLLRRGSALSLYVFCLQLFRTITAERRAYS